MIERVFAGWNRPLLDSVVEELGRRYANAEVLDLRHVVCVLPGGRAGRRLKERLLLESESRRVRLVPPRTVTLSALPEMLYERTLPLATPLIARRAWATAMRGSNPDLLQRVLPEVPAADDLRGWDRLATTVLRLHREVGAGGRTFREVAAACADSDLLFDDSLRWDALHRIERGYADLLATLGFIDTNLERIAAATEGRASFRGDLWLIGMAELSGIVKALLGNCGGSLTALVHAPPTEAAAFDEFGCVIPDVWGDRTLPIPRKNIRVVDRPSDQAAAVLEAIGRAGEVGVGDIVVGAPDEALVPYLEEWLDAAGVPAHWAGGVPLDRTGPYRLLEAVAEFMEGREWETFAALVRHPDLVARFRGPGGDGPPLAEVDRDFAQRLPAILWPGGETGAGGAIGSALQRLDRLLGRLGGSRPLQEWPQEIAGFLTDVYGDRELSSHDRRDRRLIEAFEKIAAECLALLRVPEELSERCTAAAAIRLILDGIAGDKIPLEPDGAAVELLGWLELALDDAPYVIVTGVNEPALPESVNADRFLPDSLRTRLGLLDNARRYARDAFHATALVSSRRDVTLIAGRMNTAGDPLRPSRIVLAQRGRELAERVREFAGAGGQHFSAPPPPLISRAGATSRFSLPPEPSLTFDLPEALSVTAFRTLLDDPYRFVLEHRLELRSIHDEARELDGGEFGSLAHRVLRRFGHSTERSSVDSSDVARRLEFLLDEEVAARFGEFAFPAVQLQIEQLRQRLRRFAEWQADRAADGWEIVLVEGRPAGEDDPEKEALLTAPFEVDGEAILLVGRIDRIDYHRASNSWAVLDYKTSEEPRTPEAVHRRGKPPAWIDLQLPLYRHLAAAALDRSGDRLIPPGQNVALGFVLLSRDPDAECCAIADWGADDLLDADERARDALRVLRAGIVNFAGPGRGRAWDPMWPLLGGRQLLADSVDADDEEDSE